MFLIRTVDSSGLSKPLRLEEIKRIVELLLERLRARLQDRHVTLELTEAAKEHIAREGFDPVYGARPLKRFLQRSLETGLSRKIIAGEITENCHIAVDFKNGELQFETRAADSSEVSQAA